LPFAIRKFVRSLPEKKKMREFFRPRNVKRRKGEYVVKNQDTENEIKEWAENIF
jgi:hypothetical protein